MQTSLARRQRHRRGADRGRPRGSSTVRRIAIAIPIILFAVFVAVGLAGLVGVAAAYNYYSQGLPDPKDTLSNLTFDQQTTIWDRSDKIKLASLGEFKREIVTFEQLPAEMLDATTSIEDKDFWSNPGFDVFGFVSATLDTLNGRPRGGSTITQQLVRARLLPESAFQGSREERKIREIIQSLRLTQAYPGDEGKQQIITAYLNQNFYGNQSYGVKAAAHTYFNKDLKDLTLAQFAVLAAIPQSPTAFDLVKNAEDVCDDRTKDLDHCPNGTKTHLEVPSTAEVYQRRNYILDLMKTRSPLSGTKHTADDYEEAKAEPLVLAPQTGVQWSAPHFVWQVRSQLAEILCPDKSADECSELDTGGYHVTTTLDTKMQATTEKWLYAAARAPNLKDTTTLLKNLKIPSKDWGWLRNLSGKNLNNAAAGIIDYRTGQVLAYGGSASYTAKGTRKFQPKFDVLSDGWRQPGSSIKPINYAIGIEDKTMTAATLFMDVTTDFGGKFVPTQADKLERGPVRLRSALQFSLNIPSIKAGLLNGLDHFYKRAEDFGINWVPKSIPVTSMAIGTIEVHPIDMISAYGAIANGGTLMPRTTILQVTDTNGKVVWPTSATPAKGKKVISPQAAYIITDILAGNTDPKVNPFWGEWAITDKSGRRPAAYKTGTTNDNRDVHAYGFLAPPKDAKAPALVVGVWMGNSDNSPDTDTLSLGSSAPLWSRILTDVSRGTPIAAFKAPKGLVTEAVDAFTGYKPGPYTRKTVNELFIAGTQPTDTDDFHRSIDIDAASGLLWQDGCVGPMQTIGVLDFSRVEADHAGWQKYDNSWTKRAAKGSGAGGGPKGTRTSYFYGSGFYPFGRSWGGRFAPTEVCPLAPPPTEEPCNNPFGLFCPPPSGDPTPTPPGGPGKTPKP